MSSSPPNTTTPATSTPISPVQTTPGSRPTASASVLAITPVTSPTTPCSCSPAPSAPPRKKRRAPLPPIQSPTAPPSVPITAPIVSATTTPISIAPPQTMPPAITTTTPLPTVPLTIPTPTVAPQPTPQPPATLPAPQPTPPPAANLPTPITGHKPTAPPKPPSAPLATAKQETVGTPSTIATTPPLTLPISTKAPSVQPTSPNSIASYLSLASVALGKIPSPPLPIMATPRPAIATAPSQPVLPDSSVKRQNLVGFQDGNWYKIRNVGDNSVVQLDKDGIKFICKEENEDQSDLFRAIEQPNGTYRIMSKTQKSTESIQVWDYLPHRGLLHQKKQSEKTDKYQQNWKSDPVLNFNSLYLIQSGPKPDVQYCLKNMGIGEQIKLITRDDEAASDHFAHWYLEMQE